MLRTEPDALLRSDVGKTDDSTKRRLVDAVLNAADNPKFNSDWWKLRARYRKLCYSGLARQLTRRLQGSKETAAAKIEAIDMAEACDLRTVGSILAEVALATSADRVVRIRAADVVSRLGSDNAKHKLRPLALGKRGALKNEELFVAVSDWVKIELDNLLTARGIVINREVQIHIGERTDVHVDAISREAPSADFVREKVIVEVKGCWNPDQKTAMKQQLVDQYLTNNDCTRGILLLAWFVCDLWTASDARKRKVPFRTRASAERFFARQAEQLSVPPISLRAFVLDATISRTRSRRARSRSAHRGQRQR